jgi:hypothetical protein
MENAATLSINAVIGKNGLKSFHYACERVHSAEVKIFMKNAAALSINLNAILDFLKFSFAPRNERKITTEFSESSRVLNSALIF